MQLNYKVQGQGVPVIILHGLFGSLDNWQTIARQLSESYQVYTVDQRNHGRSPHSNEHSYQLMAQDLLDFMDTHNIEKAHLLGHSMGGKTVLQFAVNFPSRVLSVISADMGMGENRGNHDDVFDALFKMDLTAIEKRSDAEEMMELLMPDFGVRQFLLKSLNRNDDGSYSWKFNLEVLYNEYHNVLEAVETDGKVITLPVLFISGSKSGYIQETDLSDFQKVFPKAQLKSLNAGHWLHAEVPQEFFKMVSAFLVTF